MTEKTPQEKIAAERQSELISNALERAKQNNGVWLNPDGKQTPRIYPRGATLSPFNSLTLALHSDQNGYKTNDYTLFSEAKKRGESVQAKERGVPFNWYNWGEYVNKHDAEDKINREAYKALPADQQALYKGVRTREIRSLFNIDQTTLPFVNKADYENEVKERGGIDARGESAQDFDKDLRVKVNEFILKSRDNMVPIYKDGSGIPHYDAVSDTVKMADSHVYADYNDYVQETARLLVSATGHPQRLAREGLDLGVGNQPTDDAAKHERLVQELASGIKMMEFGLPAKLSPSSMEMIDYWQRELKENPCLIDAIETDVNSSLAMIQKAERGEKIQLKSAETRQNIDNLQIKHYYVADEIKGLPNKDTKEIVVVRDPSSKMADVVLPAGASLAVDNEIPGMNKNRIEHALQKEGYDTVTFYNADGSLGYRPDDSFFEGKEISVAKLNKWELNEIAKLDITDAVQRAKAVDFDKVLMLRNDDGRWGLFLKPENQKSFSIIPEKDDVNRFFTVMKQGNEEATDKMRSEMAQKYYAIAQKYPQLKYDIFKTPEKDLDLSQIERVNIFKTKEKDNGEPSKIFIAPTINGTRQEPREITDQQWHRLWLADDMKDYKVNLAASLFADVLRQGRSDAVAVGTSKSEQEAQTEVKEEAQHTEFHEENEKHEQKEEQEHTDYHEEEDKKVAEEKKKEEEKKNSPEQKEKEKQEEKAKEEATKAETKAVAAIAISPMLKQFIDLKQKHPDALLLFRCGDFYETYRDDAQKASKILGITLTKSSKTKDIDGKPLAMAGFPYHALDTYLPKLIRAGQRVAICDQIEAPKQTTQRGISELMSPAKAQDNEQQKPSAFHR